jgi:transcriptional/translational regulatory protein YebC/TACO1
MEEFELELIEGGATSIEKEEDIIYVYTDFTDFGTMNTKLEKMEIEPKNAELQRIPLNSLELPVEDAKKILQLVDKFEEDDDVQNVYHNLKLTEELEEAMDGD